MANKEHVEILRLGADLWNEWREQNPTIKPDLSGAWFGSQQPHGAYLPRVNLSDSNLSSARFRHSFMINANFRNSDLTNIDFNHARVSSADFTNAKLDMANLADANLKYANFSNASIKQADLWLTVFDEANFNNTDFNDCFIGYASFGAVDLSSAKGLDTLEHRAPSTIGIDTIYLSNGQIPEAFLRGTGVPDTLIKFIQSLVASDEPIQFYSCFVSYNGKDEEFAKRLVSRLREEKLRVWFAPKDVKGGEKIKQQIDQAIQVHERLLIILSENSLKSKWVENEIRKARKIEIQEDRRKLFPIRLMSYEELQEWECFDSDTGEDLSREVREYYIPDFSNWKDYDSFEKSFSKLLRDLKIEI